MPHYFDFGGDRALVGDDLGRAEAWDALRTRTSGAFSIASTPDELARRAREQPELEPRARAVEQVACRLGARSLASYGAGAGVLEWWLRELAPERSLTLTEYAPETVAGLSALLPSACVVRHDLAADAPLDADLHVFHRIDTELADAGWRAAFGRFADERVLGGCRCGGASRPGRRGGTAAASRTARDPGRLAAHRACPRSRVGSDPPRGPDDPPRPARVVAHSSGAVVTLAAQRSGA